MCLVRASTSLETLDCIDQTISRSAFADCPSVSESLPSVPADCQLLFNASSSYAAELSAWTLEIGILGQEDALKETQDL